MPADTRLLEVKNGVTFLQCLEASLHSDLLKEWERLTGNKLIASNPLDRMIDDATGYSLHTMAAFADFVYQFVWSNWTITS